MTDKTTAGIGPKPGDERYFSLTGVLHLGKSRYFRIWTRGELFDNVLERPTTEINLDTVLCVDPTGKDPRQSQILYQRWYYDPQSHNMSRAIR
jgi:hypothetical protein